MLARLRKTQEENEGGFTLIELLVVVIIIGILAAIAIPTFLSQREKAWEKAVLSDLRNAAVVIEEYHGTTGTGGGNGSYSGFSAGTVKNSDGVTLATGTLTANSYCLTGTHTSLPSATFSLNSADGKAKKGPC